MKNPAIILFVAFATLGSAQQLSFADVANGAAIPASIKFADLSSDFKAMRIHFTGEPSAGAMGGLSSIMMMAMQSGNRGGGDKSMQGFFQLSPLNDLLWTKGQTVSIAGHDFLVTYRVNAGMDPSSMSGNGAMKLAASLSLDLIRTDTVTTIAPDSTMTADKLRQTLRDAGAAFDTSPIRLQSDAADSGVLAAILFPVFAQARQAARETASLSNLKQIGLSALMYANDYDDVYPYVESTGQFQKLTYPYCQNNEIWKDPNPNGGAYRFAMNLAGVESTSIPDPAGTPLVYEDTAWPDGTRGVAFADGHAKRVNRETWATIEPLLHKSYPRKEKKPIKG